MAIAPWRVYWVKWREYRGAWYFPWNTRWFAYPIVTPRCRLFWDQYAACYFANVLLREVGTTHVFLVFLFMGDIQNAKKHRTHLRPQN